MGAIAPIFVKINKNICKLKVLVFFYHRYGNDCIAYG